MTPNDQNDLRRRQREHIVDQAHVQEKRIKDIAPDAQNEHDGGRTLPVTEGWTLPDKAAPIEDDDVPGQPEAEGPGPAEDTPTTKPAADARAHDVEVPC